MANNATWCQNRGCICISSTRRTYGQIHAVSCIQSTHPDKNNNSVNRIIFKEKEREDPRRDSSKTSFQLESKSVSSVSTRNPATTTTSLFPHLILHTELILPQENYSNYKAHPVQLTPATVPRASKHSTRQKQSSKHPAVILGPYSTSRHPVILPGRNSILHGRQHPRTPYSFCPGRIHLLLQTPLSIY